MSSLVWPDVAGLHGASPVELAVALQEAGMIRRKIEVVMAEIVGLVDRSGCVRGRWARQRPCLGQSDVQLVGGASHRGQTDRTAAARLGCRPPRGEPATGN